MLEAECLKKYSSPRDFSEFSLRLTEIPKTFSKIDKFVPCVDGLEREQNEWGNREMDGLSGKWGIQPTELHAFFRDRTFGKEMWLQYVEIGEL